MRDGVLFEEEGTKPNYLKIIISPVFIIKICLNTNTDVGVSHCINRCENYFYRSWKANCMNSKSSRKIPKIINKKKEKKIEIKFSCIESSDAILHE